jgi:predicted nucleic acid-binding protein
MGAVQIIADDALIGVETEAKARIGSRDLDDWPGGAAAMVLDCPIWTEDRDFLGRESPPGRRQRWCYLSRA